MTQDTKAKLASLDLHKLAMDLKTAPFWHEHVGFCDLEIHELADLLQELAILRAKAPMLRYMESLDHQLRQYKMAYPDAKIRMDSPAAPATAVVMVPRNEWEEIQKIHGQIITGMRMNQKIRKWVGFHLNGHGEPDFHLVDHNPGYLAHTFQLEIEVPPEVADHLMRKVPCVLLDKFGKPVGECQDTTANETSES